MFEEMIKNLREELAKDLDYYRKWNVKSPNLAKGQKLLGLDDEELKAVRG